MKTKRFGLKPFVFLLALSSAVFSIGDSAGGHLYALARANSAISADSVAAFYRTASTLGFHVDEKTMMPVDLRLASLPGKGRFHTLSYFRNGTYQVYDNGLLNFQVDLFHALLRCKDATSIYTFIYRGILSPLQPGRHNGFLGFGSYGDDWYARELNTVIKLPSKTRMLNWSPKNSPSKTSHTFGVSAGSDGFDVSYQYSFDKKGLSVESRSSMATNEYQTIYRVSGYGSYAANSIEFFGAVSFVDEGNSMGNGGNINAWHWTKFNGEKYHGDCVDEFHYSFRM